MSITNLTKIDNPTIACSLWSTEKILWKQMIIDIGGPASLLPIETKVFYITGLIYQICESVSLLLKK